MKTSSKLKIFLVFLFMLLISFISEKNVIANENDYTNLEKNNVSQFGCINSEGSESISVHKIITITTKVLQVVLFWGSIIVFTVGFIKYLKKNRAIKVKIIELNQNSENINSSTKLKEYLFEKKRNTSIFIVCIIIATIMFCVQGMLHIINNFAAKPIIYLYPEEEQEISVVLGKPDKLECVYPKYENSWEVLAKPNGDLIDLKTNRKLYALYWEGRNDLKTYKFTEGFCIKGQDIAEFLEDKLDILGLTETEAEEFIIYWLPKLEKNKYNIIRFETKEEIEANMPLEINPKPDTIIRVMMDFKSSNKYINIPEQTLVSPERKGFIVVEWGGTEIK